MRGVIVYETLQERSYLDRIEDLSAIAFYVGLALALAYRWKSGVWRKPEILNKGDHS